ncbi:hypothetical protein D3C78_1310370 [compost metagenome]
MNTHHLFHWYGEGVERVVVAQILFGGVGETRQIAQLLKIVGMHARLIELALIHWHIVIGVVQRPFQTLQLQRFNFITRGELNGVEWRWIGSHHY